MDTYIVRVYRRGDDEDRSINGIVEEVGLDSKKAFSTVNELWMLLKADRKGKQKRKRSNAVSHKWGRTIINVIPHGEKDRCEE